YYGEYTHTNIVRDILTPYWGESLAKGEGEYKMTFTADVYPDYNLNNLYVVAFLNRDVENKALRQQIINSNKQSISGAESVNAIANDENAEVYVADGVIYINGCTDIEVYNLAGVRVANRELSNGVYIARMGNVVAKVSVR
ncbi:MAG: Omp28-related outer membrane protein, partial [Bacteroidaceae bacterium]|nr:Omp28-related outer membrane protein [Bacteroidaceae bacterium]